MYETRKCKIEFKLIQSIQYIDMGSRRNGTNNEK